MIKINRWLIAALLLIIVSSLVVFVGNSPLNVEVALIERRTFSVTIEEQGRTRAKNPYIIAAPISGRLLRSEFDEGDIISAGQTIARIALPPEDRRTEAVSQARLSSAEARYTAAEATLMESESSYERALSEKERREELFTDDLVSLEERELFRQMADAAQARLLSGQASLAAAAAEIESARSLLLGVTWDNESSIQNITTPVDGTIYRIYEESERVIQAGEALLAISHDDALEIIVDLLTQDAVKVRTGNLILISGWGGEEILYATVKNIEPEAFTKISALGVEEQRVNVIGDFVEPPYSLGAEYRIEAAIVIWKEENVVTIPTNAIFQRKDGWNTFVIEDDMAVLRHIEIGQRGREYAQVLSGISERENVIMFPSSLVENELKVSY